MVSCSDLVYYLSLVGCIVFGEFYKNINNTAAKRNCGTGLGILITFIICGSAVLHSILMVWGNIVIIKCCNKKYIHQLSLAYTWLYLIYIYYNMNVTTNYVFWVHQVIALRLVGLAFELTLAEKYKLIQRENTKAYAKSSMVQPSKIHNINLPVPSVLTVPSTNIMSMKSLAKLDNEGLAYMAEEPSAVDIISYAYYYIGLHKGPYYRWRTFDEYFTAPFGMLGNCRVITEQKLKKAFVYGLLSMALSTQFPVQVYYENDFYYSHSTDFRYLYNIPQILRYVLQNQVLMMLCTSVCTEAGFGVYPSKTQPLPGHGPSTRLSLLNLDEMTKQEAYEQEYNFGMLKSFDNQTLLMGPRMRDTLRSWDMSTRYWFWTHTYKNMVKSNKEVRYALSFLAWSLWCGPTIQQLLICSTLWVHLHLEREYADLFSTSSMKVAWDIGFSIMRLFCLIYLTPCLILKDYAIVLRYYNSIYWLYHIVLIILTLGVVWGQKERIMSRQADAAAL